MKIIHIILGKARLDRMNGINKVVHNLALHQAALGHDVSLWGITPTPNLEVPPRAYKLRFFQATKFVFGLDKELQAAIKELKGEELTFHLHGGFIPVYFRVAFELVRNKLAYVVCPHGALTPGAWQVNSLKKKWYFKVFDAFILRKASAVQFLGETQFHAVDRLLPLQRKVLIPNGQNLEELDFEWAPMDRPQDPIISFCGRLDARTKGLDLLFAALQAHAKEGGRCHLWIIGDGEDREWLKNEAADRGISDRIVFWGSQYGNEKLNLLAHSDAFVHTSRNEGMPTGVLEAAGLGLPCILSPETNLSGIFAEHQAGWRAAPNTVEAITDALHQVEQAWETQQIKSLGQNAKELVATEFNWDRIAERVLEAYE
ncbi:MAG: glycosyltransferase [Bacteroidota bacterium]